MADWSRDLPNDLLDRIINLLDSDIDLLRFGSVCSSWHSSAIGAARRRRLTTALQVLPTGISERTIYLIGPPDQGGWLVQVADSKRTPCSKRLLHPVTNYHFSSDSLPENIPMLEFRAKELHHLYMLQSLEISGGTVREKNRKLAVLWCDVDSAESSEFTLLTIRMGGRLAIFESLNRKWTLLEHHCSFSDVIVHKGKLFGLDSDGELFGIDSTGKLVLAAAARCGMSGSKKCLVHSKDGELLAVEMYYFECEYPDYLELIESTGINMFSKLDEEEKIWVKIWSLKDNVLFLNYDFAFLISSSDLYGCTAKNCVLLADTREGRQPCRDGFSNTLVFGLERRKVMLLTKRSEYSKLFWPPPEWISNHVTAITGPEDCKARIEGMSLQNNPQ